MYEYIPPQNHTRALNVSLLLTLGGTALLAAGTLLRAVRFSWIFQFLGVAAWSIAIFLYTRYIAKHYAYGVVQNEDGSADLVVKELSRKQRLTVCRLSLSGIEEIIAIKKGEKEVKKRLLSRCRREERKVFDYSAELMPNVKYYVLAEESGERFAVAIDADATLLRLCRQSTAGKE